MSTNPAMAALLARRMTPAALAHAAKRAQRPEALVPTDCPCTAPERVRGGKRSRFFVDGRPVNLCHGCAADRHRHAFAPWWAPTTRDEDAERAAFNRGTDAVTDR